MTKQYRYFFNQDTKYFITDCNFFESNRWLRIATFALANNKELLTDLNLESIYAKDNPTEEEFKKAANFFCFYLASFNQEKADENQEILSENPDLFIYFQDDELFNKYIGY